MERPQPQSNPGHGGAGITGQLGVVPGVSVPADLLTLVVPAAILLAVLVSAGPAVTAMRTRPASTLRAE